MGAILGAVWVKDLSVFSKPAVSPHQCLRQCCEHLGCFQLLGHPAGQRLQCSFPFRETDNGSRCRSRVDRLAGQTPTDFSRHPEVELDRTCGAWGRPGDQ
ncbi:hypothetical protein AOLI_G00148810 [Acnodon oligacanthus]